MLCVTRLLLPVLARTLEEMFNLNDDYYFHNMQVALHFMSIFFRNENDITKANINQGDLGVDNKTINHYKMKMQRITKIFINTNNT